MRDITNNLLLWTIILIVALATHVLAGDKDGRNTPEVCRTPFKAEDPGDEIDIFAGEGSEIPFVCIKSGNNMFNGGHSVDLRNGYWENGCYKVTGTGTSLARVERLKEGSDCQAISHIDYDIEESPETPPEPPCGADVCDDPPVAPPPDPAPPGPSQPPTGGSHVIPALGGWGKALLALLLVVVGGLYIYVRQHDED